VIAGPALSRVARVAIGAGSLILALALGGCASQPLPTYQISIANQMTLASLAQKAKYSVLQGGDPHDVDASVRGRRITSPSNGSWSVYFDDAIRTELVSSQNFDAASPQSIQATLVKVLLADGRARLSARFIVRRGDVVEYDKVLLVKRKWDSSILGAIAIPNGFSQSAALFQQLLHRFFKDPDFVMLSQR
jgi:hypothetical protein